MINRLSLSTRLLILLLVPLVLFAGTALTLLQRNSETIKSMTKVLYETAYLATTDVMGADRDMYAALSYYLAAKSAANSKTKDQAYQQFQAKVGQVNDQMKHSVQIFKQQQLDQQKLSGSDSTFKEIITRVILNFNQWSYQADEYMTKNDYATEDKQVELMAKLKKAQEGIGEFNKVLATYTSEHRDQINQDHKKTGIVTYATLIAEWVVVLLFGFLFIRKMSKTVKAVLARTKKVSEGNLQLHAATKYSGDELGQILQSVDAMTGNMRTLIANIVDNTRAVASASEQLSASASESSKSTAFVAQNIQEVTELIEVQSSIALDANKAMEEMAVGLQRIAESTTVIADHSMQTNDQADQGGVLLAKLKEQMSEMTVTIGNLDRCVEVLNDKSKQIGAITDNITSFANQTGILSLNASIEAARAGEHGRGFAVVATEIRKLATGSLESAQVINDLIADTRQEIAGASSLMRTTVEQARQGSGIMEEAAQGFGGITLSIKQVTTQIHDASSITEQLSASSEEVSASMEQSATSARDIAGKAQNVTASTEQQLALVDSIASSSERLRHIVSDLNESVGSFKL
jgi:methyl-accepting chemotaxis protein